MASKNFSHFCKNCEKSFLGRKLQQFCGKSCSNKWSKGRLNVGPKTVEHRQKIGLAQVGKPKGPQSIEHRAAISRSKKGVRFSAAHVENLSIAAVKRLQRGDFGGKQSSEISSKTGEMNHFHSSYELKRAKFLDRSTLVTSWTKNHGMVIEYIFDGKLKRYIPDFKVSWSNGLETLEEIKGWVRDPERHAAKIAAANEFAANSGRKYVVLFKADLESVTCLLQD